MIQRCRCITCSKSFKVTYAKHAYFWEVYQKIAAAHQKVSPGCARMNGLRRVRLLPADQTNAEQQK